MGRTSTYPIEFRQQATSLVLDGGRSVRDVARELGINHETLRNWVARARKDRAAGPAVLGDDERLELARLRRRVAELELEKEILKKAAVFFARETGR
jgi:transposase